MSVRSSRRLSDLSRPRRKAESLWRLKEAARKLFVERGYHATRPQDIARAADVGHGTFYLYYPDKRACFFAFVDDARQELDTRVRARIDPGQSLTDRISGSLRALYEYAQDHPGVLSAAMADKAIIDAEGVAAVPFLQRWGMHWAQSLRDGVAAGEVADLYDLDIIGQAVLGAIHQAAAEARRSGRDPSDVVQNLSRFLVRALAP